MPMTSGHVRRLAAVAVLGLAALIALPGMAFAATNPQIAATGGMTATLPILGGGVSVTVALDPAGNISGVTVSDASLTQTASSSGFVKFATTDGKTKVVVKALGSKLAISARVTTLADLVGTGTWSADVFGTGTKSSAQYTIGDDGNGNPTVTLADPTPLAAGMTWTAGTPKAWNHEGSSSATAGGTFSYNGFTKTLLVSVKVEPGNDGEPPSASLKITLSGRDRQALTGTLAALAGAGTRTWSGYLCDGTTQVTVTYHVNTDGTIAFDGATGGTAVQRSGKYGLMVVFQGTNVGFSARLKDNHDGTYTLVASGRSGICGRHGDKQHAESGWSRSGGSEGGNQQGAQTSFSGWGGSFGQIGFKRSGGD